MLQGKLSHLQPGSAPVPPPQPWPEPAAVPARQGLQEHGPGYDSEPAALWWGHFCSYEHDVAWHSMAWLHAHLTLAHMPAPSHVFLCLKTWLWKFSKNNVTSLTAASLLVK